MRDADFMLTAEERRFKQLTRRKIIAIVIGLVLASALVLLSIRPTTSAIKTWQARRHAQKAFSYIDKENWTEAHKEATAAYELRPKDPQALRAVARFLSRTRQIEALDFWKQVAEKTPLTHQDVRDEATIAIIAGDRERAEAAVRVVTGPQAEPADWLLAAQLSLQKNLRDEAKSYLEKIMADQRTTESQQLRATLLQLALAEDNQSERTNALTRLKKLAQGKAAPSLDALVVLAQNALSIPAESSDSAVAHEAVDLSRALDSHPLAKAQHKLLALDLLAHVDPAHRETITARAIANWKNAESEDLVALADWLNGKREFQKRSIRSRWRKRFNRAIFLRDTWMRSVASATGTRSNNSSRASASCSIRSRRACISRVATISSAKTRLPKIIGEPRWKPPERTCHD